MEDISYDYEGYDEYWVEYTCEAVKKSGTNYLFHDEIYQRVRGIYQKDQGLYYKLMGQLAANGLQFAVLTQFERAVKSWKHAFNSVEGVFKGQTHEELVQAYYPEPQWAIHGVFPEGCILFAGKPKHGKSFLTMDVAYAVAKKRLCLEHFPASFGNVLYFSLEDYARRIQKRVLRLYTDLHDSLYTVEWLYTAPKIGEGFMEQLKATLDNRQDIRVVIIDTLRCIRNTTESQYNLYQEDSDFIGQLNQCAQDYGITIILVHHTRKAKSDDIFDEINGTGGLRGASSANMVLEPQVGECDAILHIEGKDYDHALKIALKRTEAGGWQFVGEGEKYQLANTRRKILEAVAEAGSASVKDIADVLDKMSYGAVKIAMQRMAGVGMLVRNHQTKEYQLGDYANSDRGVEP